MTAPRPPILGYSDHLSGRPGDVISFKVSSLSRQPYSARLTRSISADPNPEGPGIVEHACDQYFAPCLLPSRKQSFQAGSYGISQRPLSVTADRRLVLSALIFPTFRNGAEQVVLALGEVMLLLDPEGRAVMRCGGVSIAGGSPLKLRAWHRVEGALDSDGVLRLRHQPLTGTSQEVSGPAQPGGPIAFDARLTVACAMAAGNPSGFFNGKIEAPELRADGTLIARWDFSRDIPTTTVPGENAADLDLVNFPARGMTGANWDGSEMCWRHLPEHYAAIHFHQDDIYDVGWETDFSLTIPKDMPSGVYVMRLANDLGEDAVPFFVCPPKGQRRARLCVLVSTFTYTIYGNHARPDYQPSWQQRIADWGAYPYNAAEYPEFGLSTYNYHKDGSGICHASHRRPLFNLRPGYITFGNTPCSGLRHFQADSHLIGWLHAKGIEYDIVTDAELHRDGVAAIEGYAAVTTGSHPEYHTAEMLDALTEYRDGGGALHYLGGNGFYWRIAQHSQNESMLEIRRAEDGIRAWAAEPGEYYNAFDGTYGGLWRRNGRPPQQLVGVGFTAQGEFYGAPYRRVCHDPAYDWIFEGIDGDVIGDFGFSGNGAAGFELDRVDTGLGAPEDLVVLARSQGPEQDFMLVPEEQLTHLTNLSGGPVSEALHADMVYFEVPGGGSVFAAGSITFCGSLPWNDYDNSVSRLLENVLRRRL